MRRRLRRQRRLIWYDFLMLKCASVSGRNRWLFLGWECMSGIAGFWVGTYVIDICCHGHQHEYIVETDMQCPQSLGLTQRTSL